MLLTIFYDAFLGLKSQGEIRLRASTKPSSGIFPKSDDPNLVFNKTDDNGRRMD